MKKLLHERLRDWANSDEPNYRPMQEMGIIHGWSYGRMEGSQFLNELADEIERYYIPRPRFEDGEPVQFGDDYEQKGAGYISEISGITVYNDGSYSLGDQNGNDTYTPGNYPAKRPQPKVFDADGIEIKVGDTVWSIPSGKKYIVNDVSEYVCTTTDGAVPHPSMLTHKEPDSLEKLRDDMDEQAKNGGDEGVLANVDEWVDRLSALIERGA